MRSIRLWILRPEQIEGPPVHDVAELRREPFVEFDVFFLLMSLPAQRTPCNCRGCRRGIANGRAADFRQDTHDASRLTPTASGIGAPIIGARRLFKGIR